LCCLPVCRQWFFVLRGDGRGRSAIRRPDLATCREKTQGHSNTETRSSCQALSSRTQPQRQPVEIQIHDGCCVQGEKLAENKSTDDGNPQVPRPHRTWSSARRQRQGAGEGQPLGRADVVVMSTGRNRRTEAW